VEARVAKVLVKAIVNRLDTTTTTVAAITVATTIVATTTSRTEEEDIKAKAKNIKDTKVKNTKAN